MTVSVRLETLLGRNGPLAERIPGFTHRPQQIALAKAVESALSQGRPCLAEAGTGVGKTLAYLVPLVKWLDKHGGKAVISTHTLALQAQLVERDIPALLEALPQFDIRPAVLKGRANFLCRQDLEVASGELWTQGDPLFRQIQRWSNETDTGDVAELDFTYTGWSDIAANQDTCRQRECRHYDRCFYFNSRKDAEERNLLVVNHALFFADLRLRRMNPGGPSLIPQYDAVVFDEAHHVEEMATRAFGVEWGSRRVPQLIARVRRLQGAADPAALAALEALNALVADPFLTASRDEAFMDEALRTDSDYAAFMERRDDLCNGLAALSKELSAFADAANDATLRDRAAGLSRTASRLSTELTQVTREEEMAPFPGPSPGSGGRGEGEREKAGEDGSAQTGIPSASLPASAGEGPGKGASDTGYFRWYQTRRMKNGQSSTTLVKTPLSIDRTLQTVLFADTPRVIFTSATLASGGGFDYLKQRLGLSDADAVEPPIEVVEGSPFDFARNCLLYIPRRLGSPAGAFEEGGYDAYADRLSEEVLALVEAAKGRTFALFTSHRMLRAVQDRLWGKCDYPLFVQGEMPTARLVEEFKKSGEGVLLGTSSFWEGVDVPGPALSCVIIDKLPFAAPDSPSQRARENAIREAGGDAFRQMSLPQAQIRLKQGFGRLLRTTADRGVVAILDNRLYTKSYGREFLADFPPCPRTDNIADVRAFFAAEGKQALKAGAGHGMLKV